MSTTILRQATAVARTISRTRGFASSSASRKGTVQLLRLSPSKNKHVEDRLRARPVCQGVEGLQGTPRRAKDAHVGAVKNFSAPSPPKAPALPQDLAAELSAYESSEPSKVQATQTTTTHDQTAGSGADGYLAFLEADVPKAEEAHH
ncbi:hypothetical protein HWV62_12282 [Athelia sp. TMB]|nr:hypothetical protein HWV62_12282 [Athelia sp. TMB]